MTLKIYYWKISRKYVYNYGQWLIKMTRFNDEYKLHFMLG